MGTSICRSVFAAATVAAAMVGSSAPAAAQFRVPGSETTIGEKYHIEGAIAWWNADPTLVVSSESLGIRGDEVDLVGDLGIEQKRLREMRLVLRPATKHKFRFNYLPISYTAEANVQREFTFNGQRYRIGLPVNTTADLTTYRFAYEYDFFYRPRGFAGVVLDLKYTNVEVDLNSPIGREFTTAVAPIPGIGFIGRGYPAKNVSVTGELTFFKIPENLGGEEFGGRYVEYDIYGTMNFNHYVGAQIGMRSIDVNYFRDLDTGTLKFSGLYFGGVIRY